jgi:serine/threonine protein phosphatase PrpC
MSAEPSRARVFTDQDMRPGVDAEALLPVAGGQVAVFSSRCPGHQTENEDAALVLAAGAGRGLLAVADGLGGRPGGASAAAAALSALLKQATGSEGLTRGAILDGVESANQAVMDLGIGAATTLSVAEIADGMLRPYHVGDSAILVAGQRGRLKLQTVSHSPVGYAVESGLLDEEEALHHEDRHLISNMVGAPDMRIEVGSALHLAAHDTVVLASDGLLDNLSCPEIIELVRTGPLHQAVRRLAEACLGRMREPAEGLPSKPDDLTFLLYRRSV